jgi:hypothetical protein
MPGINPLVDSALLLRQHGDLGGDEGPRNRFVNAFLALWHDRERRLRAALASADIEEANIVLLSIRSSTRALETVLLECTASRLHSSLKSRDLHGCRQQVPGLSAVGADTCLALSRHNAR